ncbi:3-keto-5-aminohexanoate cleavage protein [Methylobacterium aquaticum]|uniref:3-keto-5-aminohexanoate cleavage protein n=1 Tax=Methylobacterium aquaticum TaxID=270351 RepID=A0A0J6SWH8_9HYPH|nr:3-keto-5-aminohexanoate cleavage protein [Methylobacterium aquaticum]KMO37917.1 hypothetical protein VP06_07325 [Methylobacterium aquaticum]
MAEIWIEAALNGPWGRERQPGIPITVDEVVADGLAAVAEGAAIIHVHAYDPETGRQNDAWETYARIIEGIRAKADVIVYPTIPLAGSDYAASAAIRYAHTEELARRGLIEWAVCDPGSTTFLRYDEVSAEDSGFLYQNPMADIREGLRIARTHRIRPGYAIYEPGFTRLGAALAALEPRPPVPVYRFMFSDEFAWGFPPRPGYLDAHLALLAECAPGAPWMVAGLGVDILPLVPAAVSRGGHVRVGLEDAPWGSPQGNRAWVAAARQAIEASGGTVVGAEAVRRDLALRDEAVTPGSRR